MIIKIITLLLIVSRTIYWFVAEIHTHRVRPQLQPTTWWQVVKRLVTSLVGLIVCLQLLGWSIWPFVNSSLIQVFGLTLVIVSTVVSVWARRIIGHNWSHAAEYQIKKNHQLVETGIYQYIRHPIYTGIVLSIIGAELVAGSYLVIVFLVILPIVAYNQARKEEEILTKKFGQNYQRYMRNTKMFIPFVW